MSDKTGTEIIAREIAMWHGASITGPTTTIASDRGYGSWGWSPDKYADKHWREYIGAAEAMLARINGIASDHAPPCNPVIWLLDREFVGHGNESRCRTCGLSVPRGGVFPICPRSGNGEPPVIAKETK